MAKMSLLEIVQDILNDLDSDEVNSIDDTFESVQVAQMVKSTYIALMSNRNWAHQRQAIQFTASGDTALPTHVTVQTGIKEIIFINYNNIQEGETRKRYTKMTWLEPDDFLRMLNQRNNDESNVDVILDPTGVELMIRNDINPRHYTTFDDETIIFDAYNQAIDATIQSSKIQAQAFVMNEWVHDDDAIPDLPEEAFTALLEEAKSRAMFKLKQTNDAKAEQEAGRQQRWLARKNWRVNGGIKYPDYGRRGGKARTAARNRRQFGEN
jgi:hypothetical protein